MNEPPSSYWAIPVGRKSRKILILLLWLFLAFGMTWLAILIAERAPEELFLRVVVPVAVFVTLVVSGIAVVPLMFLGGRRRARVLAKRLPEAVVAEVASTPDFLNVLDRMRTDTRVIKERSFTMTADLSGVTFWCGRAGTPFALAALDWKDIDGIQVSQNFSRGVNAGWLTFTGEGLPGGISVGFLGESFIRVFPLERDEVEHLARKLRQLGGFGDSGTRSSP